MQMTLVKHSEDIFPSPEINVEANMLTHIQFVSPLHELHGCPDCDHLSPSLDDFKTHMHTAHTKTQDAVCKICHKRYKTVKSLRRHEKTHLKNVEPVSNKELREPEMPCPQCPKRFSTKTALHWHVERNHTDNEKTSTCQVCGKILSDHALLKRHLENVHSLETASCSICKKTFKSVINLQRHMAVTHPPEQAEQSCGICKKTFKCSTHLRIHVRTVHTAQTVFNCDLCNKGFSLKKYMLKHRKTHVDVKEVQCEICYQVYKTVTDARRHAKRVHVQKEESTKTKILKCHICDKEFTRTKYLYFHKKTHDNKTISCKFCSKVFKTNSHVNKHTKRVHTNKSAEKNSDTVFYCDICKKAFSKKKNLAKHIKIHIYMKKETPCDICNKLFKTNSDVNRHLKKVHMKNMNIKEMIIKNKNMRSMNANIQVQTDTENTLTTGLMDDAFRNIDFTENILASTKHPVKALEITEYTNKVPRSEDYRLATLENAEYTVETLQSTDTFESLATEHTEASEYTEEFVSNEYTKEFLRSQELTNTDFTEDAVAGTKYTDMALQSTDKTVTNSVFVENTHENTDHTEVIRCAKYIKENHVNTEELIEREGPDFIETLDFTECKNKAIGIIDKKVKSHRSKDIIKAAIESSDFSMEDLGITEVIEEAVRVKSEKTIESTVFIADFGAIELTKVPESTEFKQKHRNMDIIKAAIDISDFSMEDLGIADTEDVIDNTEFEKKTLSNTGINKEILENADNNEDLASTDFIDALSNANCKTLGNTDIIKDAIESSNFTMEDLGLTEYTEDALDSEYIIDDFGITECTETLGSTAFVEETLTCTDFIEEALSSTTHVEGAGSTKLTKETNENTDIIEEALARTEYIKEVPTEFTEDVLGNGVFTEQALASNFFAEVLENTHYKRVSEASKYTGKVLGRADFLEEVFKRADFSKEAMENAVTEEDLKSKYLIEARETTEYANEPDDKSELTIKTFENIDIIEEDIESSDFKMEGLENAGFESTDYAMEDKQSEVDLKSIEVKLLKCLRCGIDFENDIDLHTHLCGDEMTLFLDFQDM